MGRRRHPKSSGTTCDAGASQVRWSDPSHGQGTRAVGKHLGRSPAPPDDGSLPADRDIGQGRLSFLPEPCSGRPTDDPEGGLRAAVGRIGGLGPTQESGPATEWE